VDDKILAAIIQGGSTLVAALIVGIAGAYISHRFSRERDRQDKESQWRQHAIELTKLELERKLETRGPDSTESFRPSILDFLANYRDLQELGSTSPADLYKKILNDRIATSKDSEC
jgi:uncharacterized membrane-anchored protein YhcB (DUF1043 family)